MAEYMGYKSEAEFQKAIDRELRTMELHDRGGREKPKAEQAKGKPLRGKPGSPERLKQVAQLSGAPVEQVTKDWSRTQAGKRLVKAVQTMREVGFDSGAYMAAIDALIEIEDGDVFAQTMYALPEDIAPSFHEAVVRRVYQEAQTRGQQQEAESEQAEAARLKNRERVLEQEYEYAERLGPEVLDIVDNEMQAIEPDVLYSDEVSDDYLRLASRVTAQAALAGRKAVNSFYTVDAINREIKGGIGAPGSSWNDEAREKWESSLDQAAVDAYEREMPTPPEVTQAALDSLEPDPFNAQFKEELDRLSTPPAHQQRLRDLAVEDWEQTEGRRLRGD